MGTSQPHIAKIEAGIVEMQLTTARNLAKVLGVSLDEIAQLVDRAQAPK